MVMFFEKQKMVKLEFFISKNIGKDSLDLKVLLRKSHFYLN